MSAFPGTKSSKNLFKVVQFPINKNLYNDPTHIPTPFVFGGNPKYKINYDYHWIVICGIIAAIMSAYSIGANDVANSFAPSVGAKSLRLWQAVVAAAFCEFFGAYLLGARVTNTIRSNIVSGSAFAGNDDLLMIGMLIADIAAGSWVLIASTYGMPVSTTHSVIGAIIGFSMVTPAGTAAVNWPSIGTIVASWFASPILSGIVAAFIFWCTRRFILRSKDSYRRALILYPFLLAFVLSVNISFILIKSAISNGKITTEAQVAIGYSVAAGCGVGLLSVCTIVPYIRKYYENLPETDPEDDAAKQQKENGSSGADNVEAEVKKVDAEAPIVAEEMAIEDVKDNVVAEPEKPPLEPQPSVANTTKRSSLHEKKRTWQDRLDRSMGGGLTIDERGKEDKKAVAVHAHAERFSYRTENVFSFLQILTACAASFAHGANDVANAIGPLSAIVAIYENGSVEKSKKVPVPDWILLMGAGALVLGLATYGYKVMAAMGVKISKITPSRGYSIELSASLVIIVGSFLGIPLSTTHCSVGAIVGVGTVEGRSGVNWKLMFKVFGAWVFTLLITAGIAATIMAFAVYSPSVYYPLSPNNCMFEYGQLYNGTKLGDLDPVQVLLKNQSVNILAGYPVDGSFANIFGNNPQ